jgi:DNA-3-methyladenine glycosylase
LRNASALRIDATPAGLRSLGISPLDRAAVPRDTVGLARFLLGKIVVREFGKRVRSGRIVETEAYLGPHDPACHAVAGLTKRTRDLHGPPGTSYVYFVYGMYWCVNCVTGPVGYGSAVLIRALEPVDGIDLMRRRRGRADLTNGPGKLCLALGITGRLSGLPLDRPPLVVRAAEPVSDDDLVVSARIGLTKAADWPQRYYVRDNKWVSK